MLVACIQQVYLHSIYSIIFSLEPIFTDTVSFQKLISEHISDFPFGERTNIIILLSVQNSSFPQNEISTY